MQSSPVLEFEKLEFVTSTELKRHITFLKLTFKPDVP